MSTEDVQLVKQNLILVETVREMKQTFHVSLLAVLKQVEKEREEYKRWISHYQWLLAKMNGGLTTDTLPQTTKSTPSLKLSETKEVELIKTDPKFMEDARTFLNSVKDEQAERLEKSHKALTEAYLDINQRLKATEKKLADVEDERNARVSELQSMISYLEKELALQHEKAVSAQKKLDETRDSLEDSKDRLRKEIVVLQNTLREQVAQTHDLRMENYELQRKAHQTDSSLPKESAKLDKADLEFIKKLSLDSKDEVDFLKEAKLIFDQQQKEVTYLKRENERLLAAIPQSGSYALGSRSEIEEKNRQLDALTKKLENQQKINKKIRRLVFQAITVGVPEDSSLPPHVPETLKPLLNDVANRSRVIQISTSEVAEPSLDRLRGKSWAELPSNNASQVYKQPKQALTTLSFVSNPVAVTNTQTAVHNHIQLIDMYNHALTALSDLQITNQILQRKLASLSAAAEASLFMNNDIPQSPNRASMSHSSPTSMVPSAVLDEAAMSSLIEERDAWKDNTRRLEKEVWEVRELLAKKEAEWDAKTKENEPPKIIEIPDKKPAEPKEKVSPKKDVAFESAGRVVIQEESRYIDLTKICNTCSKDKDFVYDI